MLVCSEIKVATKKAAKKAKKVASKINFWLRFPVDIIYTESTSILGQVSKSTQNILKSNFKIIYY